MLGLRHDWGETMGMDELEDDKEGQAPPSQPTEPEPSPPGEEEDKSSRVDAAKAFFRAMYAGEEPPASFGAQAQQQQTAEGAKNGGPCKKCEGLEYSLKEAEAKTAEAETLYKRMAADFDNYRRRMERDREESVALGVKKAAEAMMPALDDLGRAMQFLNPETPSDKTIESFKLVANRILHCMEQVGLKKINAIGEPFDPKYHEPVQQIETTEFADGVVMHELRPGYILQDRVVRPTLVNVAANESGVVTSPGAAAEANISAEAIEALPPAEEVLSVEEPEEAQEAEPAGQEYEEVHPSDLEHTVATTAADFVVPNSVKVEEELPGRVYELEDTPD